MPAKTITFTVQAGSAGFAIARAVAEQLKYSYYDWEVTAKAAEKAGATTNAVISAEHVPTLLERMMDSFLLAGRADGAIGYEPPSSGTLGTAVGTLEREVYRHLMEDVVKELATSGGSVIVGHAAQALLRHSPNVLEVLVVGSMESRAKRLIEEEGVSAEEARHRLRRSDAERGQFLKHYYHIDWLDPVNYDLVLNTDRLTVENGVSLTVAASSIS